MKQLFQSLKTGDVDLVEMPVPSVGINQVLIKVNNSLVSLGTEKMLLDFGKASYLSKMRQQPEKVQQVLNKVRTDGLVSTMNAVQGKLEQPIPLGYSSVGVVEDIGPGVTELKVGDRVLTNGPHSEYVIASKNLITKIPDSLSFEEAAFGVVGAIGLQGVRLFTPTFGETVVVVGLGLIGLMTVQILRSNGCNVIGVDFDPLKVTRANAYGAKCICVNDGFDVRPEIIAQNDGREVDGVIITASTTSDDVISYSAQACRKRGRIILVGVTGLNLKRSDFYEKEISFQVSCSYGPGRYEKKFEEEGLDYPLGFVRWTEQRNFAAVLDGISQKRILVQGLITKKIPFASLPDLYSNLNNLSGELGILISYGASANVKKDKQVFISQKTEYDPHELESISLLGGGNFASSVLLPAFKKNGFIFKDIGSRSGGAVIAHSSRKFKFRSVVSDYDLILNDEDIKNLAITTRHNSHGALVLSALKRQKNVFVEKPLAIEEGELDQIEEFFKNESSPKPILMVGFNRRFSPIAVDVKKKLMRSSHKKNFLMTINAGNIDSNHWTQDLGVGGGRLVGEACHFIDLLRFLSGEKIVDNNVVTLDEGCRDTFIITLKFKNGDIGTINYITNGNNRFPKERLEVFYGGNIIVVDNFCKVKGIGAKGIVHSFKSQDKGHLCQIEAFKKSVLTGEQPVDLDEVFEVSRVALKLQKDIYR